jgi:hypothetical protein
LTTFIPLIAAAVSRVFLKETRTFAPPAFAIFASPKALREYTIAYVGGWRGRGRGDFEKVVK